jgi:hypothetical protein
MSLCFGEPKRRGVIRAPEGKMELLEVGRRTTAYELMRIGIRT